MIKTFNVIDSPYELGLRALLILLHEESITMTCERILFYDYYATYNLDIVSSDKTVTVLPPYPHRKVELYNKKRLMEDGLKYYTLKQIISVHINDKGVYYSSNVNSIWLGTAFSNDIFAQKYIKALDQCSPILRAKTDEEIMIESSYNSEKKESSDVILQYYEGGE